MKFSTLSGGLLAAATLVAANSGDDHRQQPVLASDTELSLRHDYKLTVKPPFFYLDNHTIPFYHSYGGTKSLPQATTTPLT